MSLKKRVDEGKQYTIRLDVEVADLKQYSRRDNVIISEFEEIQNENHLQMVSRLAHSRSPRMNVNSKKFQKELRQYNYDDRSHVQILKVFFKILSNDTNGNKYFYFNILHNERLFRELVWNYQYVRCENGFTTYFCRLVSNPIKEDDNRLQ